MPYPYLNNTGKIRPFFEHIQEAAVPPSVKYAYLSSVGFKSKNDRPLITLAKFLGFLDSNNAPTPRWTQYRDRATSPALLASSIREGYSDLFQRYPDANQRDDETLRNFFSTQTTAGKVAVELTLRTFKAICNLADFAAGPQAVVRGLPPPLDARTTPQASGEALAQREARITEPTVHIDIQIHIDSSASPEQIDQIFASMARHLYHR
ncbi:MAG: DUF5343 domain-containing protein [Chloroflexi bacterium]|nr:DUF5343 domain-containing protein [Chloroflexota bacterium]